MRETFKSLSLFSAMLLLLLMISTGCDVNIPGCGKRSLPFFKTVPAPAADAPATAPSAPTTNAPVAPTSKTVPATSAPAKPNQPTLTPVSVEKIAYTSVEDSKPALWIMNTDGTERSRVTEPGTSSWLPLWSPNGKTLAFLSTDKAGTVNLYTMEKDSQHVTQVTSWDDMPAPTDDIVKPPYSWSPKSDEVTYVYKNQVWKYALAGQTQTTIGSVDPGFIITGIEWAPHRDTKFIFIDVKKGPTYSSLIVINPRMKDAMTLVDEHKPISDISWSPDADHAAYFSGSNTVNTTSIHNAVSVPVLFNACPELGRMLAYSPVDNPNAKLMLLAKQTASDKGFRLALVDQPIKANADTGTLKFLTDPGVSFFAWSPDGLKIAYVNTDGELWTMDALTGSNKKRIAATGVMSPSWSKK